MRPTLRSPGLPITERQISGVEAALRVTLPDDYRDFLLHTNGGTPQPRTVPIIGVPPQIGNTSDIQCIYGVRIEPWHCNVVAIYILWCEEHPSALLPIACDDGGNHICMAVDGPEYGSVFFHDSQYYEDAPSGRYPWCYRLANSFTGFFESFVCGNT